MSYREKARLPDEHEAVIETMTYYDKEAMWERAKIFVWLIVPVLGSMLFGAWCFYKHLTAPNTVSFCYIRANQDLYHLQGSVEWHEDRYYGAYPSLDDALTASYKLTCEVK